MLDKNDLLEEILRECDICVHLHGKIPDGGLAYKPTEEQRDTLGLLRYLSFCAIGGARAMADGSWDAYGAVAERAQSMTADEFPVAMERQKDELRAFFADLSDEDFSGKESTLPTGETMTLDRALLCLPLKWMVGYRMQLFLYCKAAGNSEIWTPNCWVGIDWERPAPPTEE